MKKIFQALLLILGSVLFVATNGWAAPQSGGFGFSTTLNPTVTAGAYSSGQAIGGLQQVKFFSNTTQPSGILNNISLVSKGGSTTAITLYIFDTKPTGTTCTDNASFTLGAADISKLITSIPIVLNPAVIGVGTTATSASQQLPIAVNNGDNPFTNILYVCAVVGGSVTPGSTTDLLFTYAGLQD